MAKARRRVITFKGITEKIITRLQGIVDKKLIVPIVRAPIQSYIDGKVGTYLAEQGRLMQVLEKENPRWLDFFGTHDTSAATAKSCVVRADHYTFYLDVPHKACDGRAYGIASKWASMQFTLSLANKTIFRDEKNELVADIDEDARQRIEASLALRNALDELNSWSRQFLEYTTAPLGRQLSVACHYSPLFATAYRMCKIFDSSTKPKARPQLEVFHSRPRDFDYKTPMTEKLATAIQTLLPLCEVEIE